MNRLCYLPASIGRAFVAGLVGVCLLCWAVPVEANVLVVGDGMQIAPPASVDEEALTSLDTVYIFEEQHDLALPVDLDVDWDATLAPMDPGPASYPMSEGFGLLPGTIPAGTRVDSYFVHFDTPQQTLVENLQTFITFDTPILGVILSSDNLDASDPILAAVGTSYPAGGINFRGTAGEVTEGDVVEVEGTDGIWTGIFLVSSAEFVFDQMRIITVPAVPEPGTFTLLCAAAVPLIVLRVVRKARHR